MDADRPSSLKESAVKDEVPPGARPVLFTCFRRRKNVPAGREICIKQRF